MKTKIIQTPLKNDTLNNKNQAKHTKNMSMIDTKFLTNNSEKINHRKSMLYYNNNLYVSPVNFSDYENSTQKSLKENYCSKAIKINQQKPKCENINEDQEKHISHIRSLSFAQGIHKAKIIQKNNVEEQNLQISTDCSTPTPKNSIDKIQLPKSFVKETFNVYKEGYIWKFTNGLLQDWKKVYCVLTSDSLIYYNSKETQKISCALKFSLLSTKLFIPAENKGLYFIIQIENSTKQWKFKGENNSETKIWLEHLISVVKRCNSLYPAISKNPNYLPIRDQRFYKVFCIGFAYFSLV